ncbi:MAG: hypothetical protein A2Y17_00725 [Clostridiales bacterium GWF2_38_85]|nr:MAG: hypothetical protein A2Y17_00725 [Clostridiales bacterium GWF2_38_85]
MFYKNNEHKRRFVESIQSVKISITKLEPQFISSLYLLTSNSMLWRRAEISVGWDKIMFKNIELKSISPDGYTLCKVAHDIYENTSHIKFNDLHNNKLISDVMLKLIMRAIEIRRNGSSAFLSASSSS